VPILINLLGVTLIVGIVWWFWLYKPRQIAETTSGLVTVIVEDGVYTPSRIKLPRGEAVTLRFLRKDASPCAAFVVIDALDFSEELPVNKPRDLTVKFDVAGEYEFACQMKMYRGIFVVE
jgi:plastocyanin domain-containing protein